MKILGKMQRCAVIWILEAFKTFPSYGMEAIVGLVSIKLHLQKLSSRSQLQANKLLPNHLLYLLIDSYLNPSSNFKSIILNSLINQQCSLVKGHLVNMANRSYKCFPSLSSLNSELLTISQNVFLSMSVTKENILKYELKN